MWLWLQPIRRMKVLHELLVYVHEHNPELYEKFKYAEHEEKHGPHFNEHYAIEVVSAMYSFSPEEHRIEGEHWNIDQVRAAIEPYKAKMKDHDTCWDAYVAVNMWWHDLGANYKKHAQGDNHLIEDALTWAFCDPDAPEGKIWKYIHAMK